ncbi:unnamed protein product, partial [marine sediment metagenome]
FDFLVFLIFVPIISNWIVFLLNDLILSEDVAEED